MLGVILLGQSNSGKSAIGRSVAEKMNMQYISSGDIARSMSKDIQNILNMGELAPENIMRDRMLHKINSLDTDFILDGFPRFGDQYEWLKQTINNIDIQFIYVIIDAPYEDILYRAMKRKRCDDESISRKMEWFETHTRPMIEEIIQNETVYNINNGEGEDIYANIERLCNIVEEYHAYNSQI